MASIARATERGLVRGASAAASGTSVALRDSIGTLLGLGFAGMVMLLSPTFIGPLGVLLGIGIGLNVLFGYFDGIKEAMT